MKTTILRVAIVSAWSLALVTGCSSLPSVGPNYEEPKFEVPEYLVPDAGHPTTNLTSTYEYVPASAAEDKRVVVSKNVLCQWWKRFDDPLLEKLIEGGVSNNVGYLMAQRRLEQSRYELLGTYAAFLPKFTAGVDWNRTWQNRNVNVSGVRNLAYNTQSTGLNGSWEIDIFGGNRRATESALAMAEAAGWTVADAWVSLTTQIGISYISLRTTQALIDVARTNLVLQTETYDILKSRLDSGIGDELAVNQCAYIVEQTRAKIPTLLAEEESYKNALAVLLGAMPGSLHAVLGKATNANNWLLPPQRVASLKLDMMRARPDVKAAERRLAAQTAAIGVAKAQWFPKLFLTGNVGVQSHDNTKLFDGDSFFAALGPTVSWPIFQGGEIYANVKATEARMEEYALAYEESLQKAYEEVRNAYSAYTQEYHRYKSLGGAVTAAKDAVMISKDLYQNGLRDFNNVLDAQRSSLQFEEEEAISRGKITVDLIVLYRALGGGLAYEGEETTEE